MKTLLIDIGNSAIKTAYCDETLTAGSLSTVTRLTLDALLKLDFSCYQRIGVSSVGDKNTAIKLGIKAEQCGLKFVEFDVNAIRDRLKTQYDEALLGVDRWLAMLGARVHCNATSNANGIIVIDAGSAITIDVVDFEIGHLGGQIIAGRPLLDRALKSPPKIQSGLHSARQSVGSTLPNQGIGALLGTNTLECVSLGINTSMRAVSELLQHLVKKTGFDCYFCGGDGEELMRLCNDRIIKSMTYDSHLVFSGMLEQLKR